MKRAPIKKDLTSDEVRRSFDYNANTGHLTYMFKCGDVAGTVSSSGYIAVGVCGRKYMAHRVIWLLMTGEWPESEIDHINGDKADNRWTNLREATRSQNVANIDVKNKRGRTSGSLKGAYWHKVVKRWRAVIAINGRRIHLGYFDSEQEAHAAYLSKARELYGVFANAGKPSLMVNA